MSSYIFPISGNYSITSGFGLRDAPKAGATTNHPGIDISVPIGTPVLSSMAGRVVGGGYSGSRGNYVVVDHGNGITTLYQHLSKVTAKVGDIVNAGQKIALSGNSGVSTGPHLHYEVRRDGAAMNPLDFSLDGFAGGDLLDNVNTDGILGFLKEKWWLIAGAMVVIAILK